MFDVQELSILDLQQKMGAGTLTARELVKTYLNRIEQIDRSGPRLNSVIELNPEALETAACLDAERQSGKIRGPLHGIPILIKDNIDTHDRMTTTAGSLALAGSIPRQDAFLVERLRAAGAVILGKTNLSEWANFRSTRSTSGWSSRGGQTLNPYALDRTPCGSSSGSAAAVAATLCAAAVGTETDGSITCPAHMNGIVGIKPTVGLISRSGIIPISRSQDTAGPMARSVTDAAILLGALAGIDPRDEATAASQGKILPDYLACLDADGLKGARIGVARNCFGRDPRVLTLMQAALSTMQAAGAVIIDPVPLENEGKFRKAEVEVLLFEFKAGLNEYFASLGADAPVKSLSEVIHFNETHPDQTMPYFGQERMLRAQAKQDLSAKTYLNALARCRRLTRAQGIDAQLQQHRLDALVYPTANLAWLIDLINGDSPKYAVGSSSAAVAGYPCITVPAGFIAGLPLGISFVSGAWQEALLLRLAYAFEQAAQARRSPQYLTASARLPH